MATEKNCTDDLANRHSFETVRGKNELDYTE